MVIQMTATTTSIVPTPVSTTPATDRLHAAEGRLHSLYRALQGAGDDPAGETIYEEYQGADVERDYAFAAWRDSDEPRAYSTSDGHGDLIIKCAPSELEDSVRNQWAECFEPSESTWWCHVTATCDDGTQNQITVEIEPEMPRCADGGEHDFDSPDDSVRGNGGGVIIDTTCPCCGVTRTVNTWATDSYDGSQGHTSVEYKAPDEDWKLATQWVAIGSDGARLVIWAAGPTVEECEADLEEQTLQAGTDDEDIGSTCLLEIPAFFDTTDIEVENRRWLRCESRRDGSVLIACDLTDDSATYEP